MDASEDESALFQNREKEEFILYTADILGMIAAAVAFIIGANNRDSNSNAMLIGLSAALLLVGFAFERGALNSGMHSILRERVWWIGPVAFLGLLLLQLLIEGALFTLTLYDAGLFMLLAGFWIVGAGLKRLLMRGRFEQAYRRMVARTRDSDFLLSRRLLIVWIASMAFLDLIAFVFDYEEFPEILSVTLIFTIIVIGCKGRPR
ncbi:MAG: hypothetical protein EAX95_15600 [Candidatus Thorarchaeota archaeon]|nr:hypothetical protein [Candidatus Thorarchaeota archaeon]